MIYTKGLIALLTKAQIERKITVIHISRGAPLINHLLFVDDSILFCKADMVENKNIFSSLKKYEKSLDQQINRKYTSMTLKKMCHLIPERGY